jgi:hypothetical protein
MRAGGALRSLRKGAAVYAQTRGVEKEGGFVRAKRDRGKGSRDRL